MGGHGLPPRGDEASRRRPPRFSLGGFLAGLTTGQKNDDSYRTDVLVIPSPDHKEETQDVLVDSDRVSSADLNENEVIVLSPGQKSIRPDDDNVKGVIVLCPDQKSCRKDYDVMASRSGYATTSWFPPIVALFPNSNNEPKGFWSFSSLKTQWDGYKRMFFQGWDAYELYKKPPGFFCDIGSQAIGLLHDDYITKDLRGNANASHAKSSIGGGLTFWDPENVAKLLFNGRLVNCGLVVNAARFSQNQNLMANTAVAKLNFHDVLGPNTKACLSIPYPFINERLDISTLHRYAGFTAFVQSGAPHTEFSFLLGTYLCACGGKMEFNVETKEFAYSIGGTLRTSDFSLGLVMNERVNQKAVEATLCKSLDNKTTVALCASHRFVDQPWAQTSAVSVGASHPCPNALTVKGCLSSTGLASLLVKKEFGGNCSVVLSSGINLGDFRRGPKFGVSVKYL